MASAEDLIHAAQAAVVALLLILLGGLAWQGLRPAVAWAQDHASALLIRILRRA